MEPRRSWQKGSPRHFPARLGIFSSSNILSRTTFSRANSKTPRCRQFSCASLNHDHSHYSCWNFLLVCVTKRTRQMNGPVQFFSSHIAQLSSQSHGRYQQRLTSQPRHRRAGPLNPYLHRSHPSQRNETLKHVRSTLVLSLLDRIQVLSSFSCGQAAVDGQGRAEPLNTTLPLPANNTLIASHTIPVTKSDSPDIAFTLCPASSQSTTIRLSCHRRWRGASTLHTALLPLGLVFFSFPSHPSGPFPDMRVIPPQG